MSLYVKFDPHSWYMGCAIEDCRTEAASMPEGKNCARWYAVTDNGNTGYIVEFEGETLTELKQQIREYHQRIKARDADNRRRLGEKN